MIQPNDLLENWRKRYEAGDKTAILYCLDYCLINSEPVPSWLATAFHEAFQKVQRFEVKSWDDVFDRPLKKGRQLRTERRKLEIAEPLFNMVSDRHAQGAAIDDNLFDDVGSQMGLSGSVAKALYYEILHEMAADD